MSVELKEVKDLKDLKKFVRFPFSLYKNNKYWIPPIIKDEINTLRKDKNPSFDFCEVKFILAYKNGKLAGRIAGIINRSFIQQWGEKYVQFSYFDFIDDLDVSSALINYVEQWGLSKGMESIMGPTGFTTFEHSGLLIFGFDEIPTIASAYNYEYYVKHYDNFGLKKETDYVEYEVNTPKEIPEKAKKIRDLIIKRYKLKSLDGKTKKELLPYAEQIFDVINASYKPLFGFVPLTKKQIDYYVKKFFSFIQPEYITAVLHDNRVVGFQISIPSLSHAFQKAKGRLFPFGFYHIIKAMKNPNRIDILLVGVHPEYQNKGVNAIFMTDLTKICIDKKILYAESNKELEENDKVQNFWRYFDTRQHKKVRIYKKSLSET